MVVGPGLVPVRFQVLQVEIETLDLARPFGDHVHGCGRKADRGQPRRGAQALLGGTVANVDAPVVHPDFMSTQRSYRVHDGQRARLVDHINELFHVAQHPGGCLGMDHAYGLKSWVPLEFVFQHLGVNCFAPRGVHHVHGGAAALCDIGQADAEVAVPADKHRVTRLNDVGAGGLHGASAGGGDGHSHGVGGVEDHAQHLTHVIHDLEERRVQVTHYGKRQGLQYPGVHGAWSGAQQHFLRGLQFFHVGASQGCPSVPWTFSVSGYSSRAAGYRTADAPPSRFTAIPVR